MTAQLPIHPEDFDALLKYFARANQFHYDGYCTEDEFEAVQEYIDQIKDLALNYRQ
jgi:hypothetical protein